MFKLFGYCDSKYQIGYSEKNAAFLIYEMSCNQKALYTSWSHEMSCEQNACGAFLVYLMTYESFYKCAIYLNALSSASSLHERDLLYETLYTTLG